MSEFQPILDNLAKEYGFTQLSFVREPEKGISTKNLIVEDNNRNTYFVKKHKRADLLKIENSERSAGFVNEHSDVPVVLPMKNNKGEWHTDIDGDFFSIFPYVAHAEYHPSETERIAFTYHLGEMLGKIHAVSRTTTVPESIKRISAWVSDSKEESLSKFEKIRKVIDEKETMDEYDNKALAFIELKTSLLHERTFIEQEKGLTICHGDYHTANLLFNDKGGMIGVCDWDISGMENPYNEFIRSFNMCVVRRGFDHLEDKRDVANAFLRGYTSTCGFTFELGELEYAIEAWYQKLLTLNWPLSDHYYLKHFKTDPSLDSEFNKVVFLRDRRGELLALVSNSL